MASGVLVIAEVDDNELKPATFEMLGAASRVAGALGGDVSAALLGSGLESLASELFAYGAKRVYVVDDPVLKDYLNGAQVTAAETAVRQADPAVVMVAHTPNGRDLGARLAFRLGVGAAMDVIEVSVENGAVKATRSAYGGNARAKVGFPSSPALLTVRPKTQEPNPRQEGASGEVVRVSANLGEVKGKVVGHEKVKAEGVALETAERVVSGGRGMGGPENFEYLENLARVLNAAVGASRAVCDLGWYPVANQVGLTGKIVSPTLYLAVAISGASQHMAGIGGARNIVAVNKDPDAPIFKASKFGIVGDWKQIIPPLTEEIRKLVS